MRSVPLAERAVVGGIVVHAFYAAVRSWRSRSLEGRPLGIGWPFGPSSSVVLWGSAVAPPLILPVAFVASVARNRRDWLGMFGAVLVVGQLSEPAVYRRSLGSDAWARPSFAVNVAAGGWLAMRWRTKKV